MNSRNHIQRAFRGVRWLLLTLVAGLLATSHASIAQERELKPIDKLLRGVADPKMRERWKQAEAEGKLPPIEAIPIPEQPVTRRRRVEIKEPAVQPRRPVIPAKTVADAQPFSLKPIARYQGVFQVTKHDPGVLIGTLQRREEPLELHYKLPGERRQLAIPERAKLQLSFRDEVVDSALQRHIVLRTQEGTTPFVYIAEGSQQPYRQTFDEIKLVVEQQRGYGNPPVKVTYAGNTVTLKQRERQKLGEGERAVEVYLLASVAMSPQLAMLQEGQPYYVSLILYRAVSAKR